VEEAPVKAVKGKKEKKEKAVLKEKKVKSDEVRFFRFRGEVERRRN
jgi:hypothetical protein